MVPQRQVPVHQEWIKNKGMLRHHSSVFTCSFCERKKHGFFWMSQALNCFLEHCLFLSSSVFVFALAQIFMDYAP
jgi:ribonucleotide reductase beta subunit family protein with ferritin-like domain